MPEKILFIVGVGRSGTTLLQNMINSHSKVAFIPEINFTRRFLFNSKLLNEYKKGIDSFLKFIKSEKWLNRLDSSIINKLKVDKITDDDFSIKFYKQILLTNCKNQDKSIGGDKDPRSIEIVDKIENYIPNIHWIHIIRDPRDVIVSKKKATWSKNQNNLKHIISGTIQLQLAVRWREKYQNKFTEIFYEDLIQSPEESLKAICSEIGINFEKGMLDFQKSAKTLIAKDELDWKKSVFNSINVNNHSKWKEKLSSYEIALIESINNIAFNSYNYQKDKPAISLIKKLIILLLKSLVTIIAKIYIAFRFLIYR